MSMESRHHRKRASEYSMSRPHRRYKISSFCVSEGRGDARSWGLHNMPSSKSNSFKASSLTGGITNWNVGEQLAIRYDKRKARIVPTTDDKTQRRRGAASCAACEQPLDGVARLEARRGAFFPPSNGTPCRIDKPLLEDMVEDVLNVEELRGVADVDELRSDLFTCMRCLVVCERSDEVGVLQVVGEESLEYVDDASLGITLRDGDGVVPTAEVGDIGHNSARGGGIFVGFEAKTRRIAL